MPVEIVLESKRATISLGEHSITTVMDQIVLAPRRGMFVFSSRCVTLRIIMTTQPTQYPLTMQPVMWTHSGEVIRPTDPAMRYKVFDERGDEVAFITNTRASGRSASWQIFRIIGRRIGIGVGDYATAEDALSALQQPQG